MLNKNDPLIAAVQKVMETNQAERNAVAVVNEKFGVTDRKALPRERQHEWDSAYKTVLSEGVEALDEKKNMSKGDIAALRHPKKKFTSHDLAALRAGEHKMEEAKKMKGDDPCWDNYEMIGMKKKGGKEVPNCVPVKEEGDPSKAIRGDTVTGSGSVTPVPVPKPTPKPTVGEPDQKALANKIKSVMEEWSKKQRNKQKEIADAIARENPGMSKSKKFAIAGGAVNKMKTVKEGFNNRHDLSVTASVEEQVVAEQTSPMPVSGVQNSSWFSRKTDMQRATQDASKVARLRAMRKKSSALSPDRNAALDTRTDKATEFGKTLDSVLVPFAGAKQKFDAGDKKGAAVDAAIDAATYGLGGPIARLGKRVVDKGIDAYRASSKVSKVDNVAQAGTTASQAAPATSQAANKFRANLANRRYNVAGAQQRPPQSVTPAAQPVAQGSVPAVAQGTGQGNRLAATRRADNGPWGSTPPAASASKLKVAPGTAAARLQASRQAQSGRAGVNTAQATQTAARAANARQSSQALGGFGKTANATNALRARQSSQALGGFGNTVSATNALRARQSSQALGGFGRATSSLGNIVRKNPKLAAGAAAGAAMTGFAATQVGNKSPSTQADTGPEKIKTSTQTTTTAGKVSDRDIMNDPRYKAAVNKVGGEKGARKIAVGKTVDPVGKFAKGETIWSKVKSQLEKERSQPKTTTSVVGGQGIAAIPGGASNVPSRPASTPTSPMASQGSSGATQSKVLPQRQASQPQSMSQNAAIGSMQPRSGQQGMTVTQRRDSNYNSGVRGR